MLVIVLRGEIYFGPTYSWNTAKRLLAEAKNRYGNLGFEIKVL